mgnify:CR=1 FL=1
MAIALRHMAMVSLMETGHPFNHDDPLHQDNIWEIEILRMELQKKCDNLNKQWSDIHGLLNKSDCMGVGRPTHDNFDVLSHEIFDTLSYSGGIEDSEIPWKEYFHVVYEFVVIDDVNYDVFEIKKHIDALNMWDSITPPSDDPPTQRTRYIDSLLNEYIRVHKEYYKNVKSRVYSSHTKQSNMDILNSAASEINSRKQSLDCSFDESHIKNLIVNL